MRIKFDEQLALLNRELTAMGAYCEEGIELTAQALSSGKKEHAKKTGELNVEVRQLEREIETQCLKLLLQQQPVARDLRQISAALKMVTDLERISEQASDIGRIIVYPSTSSLPEYAPINHMAQAAIKMVKESVEAYVKQDIKLAESVILSDDIVDDAFDEIKKDLIHMISEYPEKGEPALDLLMIAKYLEGIGDHAVNVAQWVRFSVSGILPEEEMQDS